MKKLRDVLTDLSKALSLEQRLAEAEVRQAFHLLPESRDLRLVFVNFREKTLGLAYRYPGDGERFRSREAHLLYQIERLSGHRFERIHWMLDRKGGTS